ncbi:MAG: sigma 54-interacting transcriptional regulator [Bilophila wadsworthia]
MPDVRESLIAFYKLLKETFPLEGMVMHHFLPSSQSLLELHFIHDGGIHFLGRFIPFSREQTMFLRAFSLTGGVNAIPNSQEVRTAESVNNDLREFIENRPRAHLVCCLKGAGAPLGLLRLIGTEVGCFTEEHERRLGLLAIPLSFALVKVLREEEVQRFFSAHGYDTPSQSPHEDDAPAELIGTSGGLRNVMETVRKLSGTDAPVLILGETGTGKELVANAIQARSQRVGKPFIKVNCGAIPETLMDSTLFGHEKGAFTGAHCAVGGKFELANGGTLFLDELGELSLQAQVRLLRTLQNHVVERVGSTTSIPVDVRIIAATNRDLHKMLREGTFREDLYHRLNVFTISVPPLRERLQDLLPLARHFIDKATRRLGLPPISGIEPDSAERLLQYDWPATSGNWKPRGAGGDSGLQQQAQARSLSPARSGTCRSGRSAPSMARRLRAVRELCGAVCGVDGKGCRRTGAPFRLARAGSTGRTTPPDGEARLSGEDGSGVCGGGIRLSGISERSSASFTG